MRRASHWVLAGAAAVGVVLALAAPASAHNWVVSSTPADGQVLTELPDSWELETNESLLYVGNDEVFGLLVRDADGLYYGDGCVDVSGAVMTAAPAIGEPGDYELVFAFISADGHPLTGEIPFQWSPAGEFEAAAGFPDPPRCGGSAEDAEQPPASASGPSSPGIPSDVWWIIGAALAVVAAITTAVVLTVVLSRRGSRPRS